MSKRLGSKFNFPALDSLGRQIPEDLQVEAGSSRRQITSELPWRLVAGVQGYDREGKVRDILQLDQVGEFAVASTLKGVRQFAYLHAAPDPEHPGVRVSAVVTRPSMFSRLKSYFGAEVQVPATFEINLPVIKNDVELVLNQ